MAIAIAFVVSAGPAASWEHDLSLNDEICDAGGETSDVIVVSDDDGGWYVVWQDERDDTIGREHYAQRLDGNGHALWPANGIRVVRAPNYTQFTCAAAGANGDLYFAYTSNQRAYVQKVAPDGSLPWGSDGGLELTPGSTGAQWNVDVVSDGNGGVIVVVEDGRDYATTNYDIWAQHVDAAGTRTGGPTGFLVMQSAGTQGAPRLVLSEPMVALVFWEHYLSTSPTHQDIHGQCVDFNDGDLRWGNDGVVICDKDANQTLTDVCADGYGGAHVAWKDHRASITHWDIYAQRISSSGMAFWEPYDPGGGLAVCTTDDNQEYAIIASDGSGGALIAWEDSRSDLYTANTVYAQYVGSNGAALWEADGVAPFKISNNQYTVKSVHDGNGSWYVAILKDTAPRIQKLDRDGFAQWSGDGVEVSHAVFGAGSADIVLDDQGGVIGFWEDRRSGTGSVYAQRLDRWGLPGDASPGLATVVDRPADQGGEMIVSWAPSHLDNPYEAMIDHYSVWMRYDGGAKATGGRSETDLGATAQEAGMNTVDVAALDKAGWAMAGRVTAYWLEEYAFIAPSYGDSTATGIPLTSYKVLSHNVGLGAYWESGVLTGYSVDDLAPGTPLALLAARDGLAVDLEWAPSGSHDEDLAEYRVYRSADPGFTPGPATLVGTASEAVFRDTEAPTSNLYYRVAAVDIHGNEGSASNTAQVDHVSGAGSETPVVAVLHGAYPNPFNPSTTIAFDLPRRQVVSLRVYDLAGRVVAVLMDDEPARAGRNGIVWRGTDDRGRSAGAGVYLCRMETPGCVETKRLVLVR